MTRGRFTLHALSVPLLLVLLVLVVGLPGLDKGLFGDDLAAAHSQAFGGLASLSPLADFSQESPTTYWARQAEIRRLISRGAFDAEQYRPPLPALLHKVQALAFGGWLVGYRAVSLLLHGLLVLVVFRLARRLGMSPLSATATAAIVAVHPLLAPAMSSLGAQRYYLAALGALLALERGLAALHEKRGETLPVLLLVLGLLSDMSALCALPMLLLIPADTDGDPARAARLRSLRQAFGLTVLTLLAFRLLMPVASGAHSPDGAYQQAMIAWFLSLFGARAGDLALMFAIVPPPVILLLPVTAILPGLFGPLFLVAALFRAVLGRSVVARIGLVAALCAWLVASFGPARPEDAVLPVAGFAFLIVDATGALAARLGRGLSRAGLVLLALLVLPSAIWYHRAAQDLFAGYAVTSRRLAEQLDATLPPLEPGARLLLVNGWGGASFLPQEWQLLTGRGDVEVRLLTLDPEHVPFGLPLPDLWHTRPVLSYTRWRGADTAVSVTRLSAQTLHVSLPKGVYLASPGDFAPDGEYIRVSRKPLEFPGMTVIAGPWRENHPSGFRFRFSPDMDERQTVIRVWREGCWQAEEPQPHAPRGCAAP